LEIFTVRKVGNWRSANGVKLGGDGNLANPKQEGGAEENKTVFLAGEPGYGGGGKGGEWNCSNISVPKC